MMFKDNLKLARKNKGLSQAMLAQKLFVSQQAVAKWETDKATPNPEMLTKLSNILDVTVDYLLGNENKIETLDNFMGYAKPEDFVRIPLVGQIACGTPILALENIEEYIDTPKKDLLQGETYFYLKAKGNSMVNVGIFDGDLVLIRMQNDVDSGDIAVVLVDDEATLKRVIKKDGAIVLKPESSEFLPQIYVGKETEKIRIIGRLMEVKRKF